MSASPLPESPYRPLEAFSESDAEWFFGRESEQRLICSNLLAFRLTVLYGRSGVGKSSVLQAGVIPLIRSKARRRLIKGGVPQFAVASFAKWSEEPVVALCEELRRSFNLELESTGVRIPKQSSRKSE